MIVECREICDACYNCVHSGGCRWDHARQCMIREEPVKKRDTSDYINKP